MCATNGVWSKLVKHDNTDNTNKKSVEEKEVEAFYYLMYLSMYVK